MLMASCAEKCGGPAVQLPPRYSAADSPWATAAFAHSRQESNRTLRKTSRPFALSDTPLRPSFSRNLGLPFLLRAPSRDVRRNSADVGSTFRGGAVQTFGALAAPLARSETRDTNLTRAWTLRCCWRVRKRVFIQHSSTRCRSISSCPSSRRQAVELRKHEGLNLFKMVVSHRTVNRAAEGACGGVLGSRS